MATYEPARMRPRGTVGLRLVLVLVLLEAVAYFVGFLAAAARLGAGDAAAVVTVDTRVLGRIVFHGVRDGSVTTVQAAGWLLPLLLGLPVVVWGGVGLLNWWSGSARRC